MITAPVAANATGLDEADALLERDEPLSSLAGALTRASAGYGQLILVSGEAGIGKTSLLRRFASAVADIAAVAGRSAGARVLWGMCDPLFTPRPLGPFFDIAEQLPGEFAQLIKQGAKPHEMLAAFLRELRSCRPTVAVIEDAHWADEASLDLLELIGRRVAQVPAVVVASYRDDELGPAHPLQILLGRLATANSVLRIRLRPLSRQAVERMASPRDVDVTDLYMKTGGNPFFVTEVLGSGAAMIPPTIRDAVMARAGRAGPAGRKLLEAVAVMAMPLDPSLLKALAGADLAYFEDCLASGMLVQEHGRIGFRHELARLAVQDAIPPARRVALHRAALLALLASPVARSDPASLAHHAEWANDPATCEFAAAAAIQAAAVGAHREAAAQYGRALRFGGSLPASARASLHERHSYECYLSDQPDQALQARREALAAYRSLGDSRGEGESLCWLSRLLFFASRQDEAEEAGRAAIAILEAMPPGRELAMAYSTMSHARMLADDMAEAIGWGERAAVLAELLGESEVLAHALNNVGTAQFCAGLEEGRRTLELSLALASRAGLTEHVIRAYVNLASTAIDLRRYELGSSYLADGLAFAAGKGLDAWRWYLLAVRARGELETGRWAQAQDTARVVLESARPTSFARLTALVVLARLRARQGAADCWPLLDEALDIALLNSHLQQAGLVASARAEAAWLAGDYDLVGPETGKWLELARQRNAPWIYGELGYWRWKAGLADSEPGLMAEPFGLQVAGEWAAASHCWSRLECPYEAALALADSDDESALCQALAMLTGLGARRAAAVTARRLRALGVRGLPRGPRAATSANPANLTVRQAEVLGLMVQGLPNGEIAARLVLSPKTVEHHVSAILRKLEVRSRGEAREAAIRRGLAARSPGSPM